MSLAGLVGQERARPDLAALEPGRRARIAERLAGQRQLGRAELQVVAPRALGIERVGEGGDDVGRLTLTVARGGEDLRRQGELAARPRRVPPARVELRRQREGRAHAPGEVRRQRRAWIVGAERRTRVR